MTDIAVFLLARFAGDEAVARGRADDPGAWGGLLTPEALAFWRFGPTYVLTQCEANRRIVAEHTSAGSSCPTCADFDDRDGPSRLPWPCPTIRALAIPYAEHPDFRPEWAL